MSVVSASSLDDDVRVDGKTENNNAAPMAPTITSRLAEYCLDPGDGVGHIGAWMKKSGL